MVRQEYYRGKLTGMHCREYDQGAKFSGSGEERG